MSITPRSVLLASGITLALIATSCGGSGGSAKSSAPQPGSVGHAWFSAQETYKQGNYLKTMEYLSRVASSQNENRDRARLMMMVVAGGVADGYAEAAAAYETGSKVTKTEVGHFRRHMSEARNIANQASMEFVTAVHEYLENNKKDVKPEFAFGFPGAGTATEPLQYGKVLKGMQLQDSDDEALLRGMAQRGVIRFASALAGAPNDPAKGATQFANPPRDTFLAAVAEGLYKRADLYCNKKMDIPQRGNALCKQAAEAAALLPEGKQKKALESKIKEETKRYKVAS